MTRTVVIAGEHMNVRDAVAEDCNLILQTWVKEASKRGIRNVRRDVMNRFYPRFVADILASEPAVVLTRDGSNTIHAWACGRAPNLLHFAYVPLALRRQGLGRAVISAVLDGYPETIFVTSSPLANAHYRRFVFNPFIYPLAKAA